MKKALPILVVLILMIGFFIGKSFNNDRRGITTIVLNNDNKLSQIFGIIGNEYVDETDIDSIIERSIPKILEELDPHSTYVPKDEVEEMTSDLQSSFSGIGIRFTIQEDTIDISEVIRGGPSEEAGVLDGDRIITINDSLFVGKDVCTNQAAMKKLKGPKGSFVKLGLQRFGEKELVEVKIRRDDIEVKSIETAYLLNGKWGYIMIERFAENTFAEFIQAMIELANQRAQGYIIDLRGNGGGYLGVALEMANQFLGEDEVIVYTEGANIEKQIEKANGYGFFQDVPLVILVDETSASASEIMAGTIQDNDRGTVIGRRTFGKGLVQKQMDLADGSMIRLTIARYHTPSGRCIQKPYTKGDGMSYAMDLIDRYNRGEFFSQDSIHQNEELIFKTKNGRTVYGGGGIMPDIFVASDTTHVNTYTKDLFNNRVIAQYTLNYCKANRQSMKKYMTYEELTTYLSRQPVLDGLISFARTKGITPKGNEIAESREILTRSLYSNIIYHMLGMMEHIKFVNLKDPTVLKAVEVLESGKAFPEIEI